MFRDEEYQQLRDDLCEDNHEAQYSDCCQGSPIGECRKCGWLVCEDHGQLDSDGDAWCSEHAPDDSITITPLQIVMLAELSGVAL